MSKTRDTSPGPTPQTGTPKTGTALTGADRTRPGKAHDGPIDYGALYRDYWSRQDRWGSHSFADPEPICDQILTTCGGGRVLDVGCGMGLLVRTMLRRGVDAQGVDVAARPIAEANRLSPGRFRVGSITDLPFEDGSFQTVVSTDVLEHVAQADVPQALAQLARVTSRYAYIRLAITPDRDHTWHLTVRERAWWEARLFEAGFARHPLAQRVVAYEALNDEGWQITLLLEKTNAAHRDLPAGLDPALERDRDVLTEPGRAAEAAICRATRALWFVRPGDTVVDAAGGLGWRAMILATGSRAERVVSLDPREEVSEWAERRFGRDGLPVEYACAPLGDLSRFADRSVGVLMAIDVLDHLDDPGAFLDEAKRVLVPGGRLVVGDPAQGDPDRWTAALNDRFVTERLFVQTLGRDAKGDAEPGTTDDGATDIDAGPQAQRTMRIVDDEQDPAVTPDWTMRVVASEVIGAPGAGYIEKSYPDHTDKPGFHVANYARDHDNPWLLRSMISMGTRSPNKPLIEKTARRVLESARPGSPDEGSAICVLGYRLLESDSPDPDEARALIERIEAYHGRADDSPHGWRWRISNQFVAARLHQALGELPQAHDAYLVCAGMDVLRFSPLLASKTIDSLFQAGLLAANAGHHERAREHWSRALNELQRVLSGDWLNIWGSPEAPLPFGLPDIGIMVDLASRCAFGLVWLDEWAGRPGLAWTWTHQRSLSDHRRWIARLEESRSWLDRERGRIRTLAISRERTITQLKAWAGKLQQSQQWLTGQRDELRERLEQRGERLGELKNWTRAHTEARSWMAGQLDEHKKALAARDATIDDLRAHIAKLGEARAWLEDQLATARQRASARADAAGLAKQLERRDQRLADQRGRIGQLHDQLARLGAWSKTQAQARDWQAAQLTKRDATIATLKSHIAKLGEARAWQQRRQTQIEEQREALRKTIARRDEQIEILREWSKTQAQARDWQAAQLTQREATIATLKGHIARLGEARAWQQRRQTQIEEQREALRKAIAQRDERIEKLEHWSTTQADARDWQAAQLTQRDATIDELKGHIARLGEARAWLEGRVASARLKLDERADGAAKLLAWAQSQRAAAEQLAQARRDQIERIAHKDERLAELRTLLQQRGERLAELRAWSESQASARLWQASHNDELRQALDTRDATIDELRRHIAQQSEARAWLKDRLDSAQQQLEARTARLGEQSVWAAKLGEGQRWLKGQRDALAQRIDADRRVWHELGLADESGRPLAWTRTARADLAGLRAWAEQLLEARGVLQQRLERAVDQSRQHNETIADLHRQIEQLKAQQAHEPSAPGRGDPDSTKPGERPGGHQ